MTEVEVPTLSQAEEDQRDAARFRALCTAARIRRVGWAGFNPETRDANMPLYRHLTLDFWSTYEYTMLKHMAEAEKERAGAVQYMTELADTIIEAARATNVTAMG